MKRLTLVRHAHAEPKHSRGTDFERALTPRGHAEAEALAGYLPTRELIPDFLMTSPARRAKQTTEILAREFKLPANAVEHEGRLYLAAPSDVFGVLRSIDPKIQHLMIVGHNPGVSELARLLASDAELAELSTAMACTMGFDADTWAGITCGGARDVRYESKPRRL